jgi:hypothetical protein
MTRRTYRFSMVLAWAVSALAADVTACSELGLESDDSVDDELRVRCDDGDPCTLDQRVGRRCEHVPVAGCGPDAAVSDGATSDAGEAPTAGDVPIPGHRRITWSPGVRGGIPSRTSVCATVDVARYGHSTGTPLAQAPDATLAIQSAIDGCAADQVVVLPAGNYRITNSLRITRGITLRGASTGPAPVASTTARSKIILDNAGVSELLIVGRYDEYVTGIPVTSGMSKDSRFLTVADASMLNVGDIILIDELVDTTLMGPGWQDLCGWNALNRQGRNMGQRVEIVGKSGTNGTTLELSSPLYLSYKSELRPEVTKLRSRETRGVGVEDLYLTRAADCGVQGSMVSLYYPVDSWVTNVETSKVCGRHIRMFGAVRNTIRGNYMHHAWSYSSGGVAYGLSVAIHASDNLVEDNVAYWLNNPITLETTGGGNVLAYNYSDDALISASSDWQMATLGAHCAFPHMDLVEGNWLTHVTLDNYHGGASFLTFFRNYVSARALTRVNTSNVMAFQIMENNYSMNVIGNVLMSPGMTGSYETSGSSPTVFQLGATETSAVDARVAETLLRVQNFDHVTNTLKSDGETGSAVLPSSLYRTSAPAYWAGNPWPLVDPKRTSMVGQLPAKQRFERYGTTGP